MSGGDASNRLLDVTYGLKIISTVHIQENCCRLFKLRKVEKSAIDCSAIESLKIFSPSGRFLDPIIF